MSVIYKIRPVNADTVINEWDNIIQSSVGGLTHTLPIISYDVTDLYPIWFLVDSTPITVITVDGTVFFSNGTSSYTIASPGFYKFEYVQSKWYMTAAGASSALTDVNINKTFYVDNVYGNDSTAVANSLAFKYATMTAALNASSPGDVIHILPGTYVSEGLQLTGANATTVYCEPGVTISTPSAYVFAYYPGVNFKWLGKADFVLTSSVCLSVSPSSTIVENFEFEFGSISSSGVIAFDWVSTRGYVRGRSITDSQSSETAWNQINYEVDFWNCTNIPNISYDDVTFFGGAANIDAYGSAESNFTGYSKDFCEFSTITSSLLYTFNIRVGGAAKDRKIRVRGNIENLNSYVFYQNSGSLIFDGNIYWTKDNTAGNEIGWYFADASQTTDVYFEYRTGRVFQENADGANPDSTSITIRNLGIYRFNCDHESGKQVNFPVMKISGQQNYSGETKVYIGGNWKSDIQTSTPEFAIDAFTGNQQIKLFFTTCVVRTGPDRPFLVADTSMFDYFVVTSLASNSFPDDTTTKNASSYDRLVMDSSIELDFEGPK